MLFGNASNKLMRKLISLTNDNKYFEISNKKRSIENDKSNRVFEDISFFCFVNFTQINTFCWLIENAATGYYG